MQTTPQCLPCLRRQAEYATNLATQDLALRAAIMVRVESYLSGLNPDQSPPVNAIGLYGLISRLSATPDPFADLKQHSNALALGLRPRVEALIGQGGDPLYRAILFAMAGNIIDYGSQQNFDLDHTLDQCLHRRPVIDAYARLRHDLTQARSILYLADNCGELVFDGLLIDRLPRVEVTMAVKAGPIINDATLEDAEACGLSLRCRVITNGTVCPGTPLPRCSREFRERFATADLVISKGQGNFETLSEEERPVYHLLTVKCPVVADHIAEINERPDRIPVGSSVLMRLGMGQSR